MFFTVGGIFGRRGCNLSLRAIFYSTKPEQASREKLGKVVNVAIIGAPNSGKSTLINKIVERKVCPASCKVHTTTKLARAMCFQDDTQIIFLDTPGIITAKEKKKYQLPDSMLKACYKSLNCANVIGVVHDVSCKWTKEKLHRDLVTMLNMVEHIPSFLILNKVDVLKSKHQLLSIIRNLTNGVIAGNPLPGSEKTKQKLENGYEKFSDVFLVSALNGDGVEDIKKYLIDNAQPANFQYSPDKWTDQEPEQLIVDAVRAKFLDFLSQEIPYKLKVSLEYFDDNIEENKVICHVVVECPTERLMRLVSGAGGGRLAQIRSSLRNDLTDTFKKPVFIEMRLNCKNKEQTDST